MSHSPGPVATDGEAANPGPRLRRRGPRSAEARARRALRHSSPFGEEEIRILHANVRGVRSKRFELEATIQLLDPKPEIVCLNETFLDKSVEEFVLQGFQCVARRDRPDGWGGIAVYAADAVARRVVLIEVSEEAERCWLTLRTQMGPL